mgnify:CR=1 FL=1
MSDPSYLIDPNHWYLPDEVSSEEAAMTIDTGMWVILSREGGSEIHAIAVCLTESDGQQYLVREGYTRQESPQEPRAWYERTTLPGILELAIVRHVPWQGRSPYCFSVNSSTAAQSMALDTMWDIGSCRDA